jgi:hypothetical protein
MEFHTALAELPDHSFLVGHTDSVLVAQEQDNMAVVLHIAEDVGRLVVVGTDRDLGQPDTWPLRFYSLSLQIGPCCRFLRRWGCMEKEEHEKDV